MPTETVNQSTTENLFSGYAVAIDEKIHQPDSGDLITQIVSQIEDNGIPLVKYDAIPIHESFATNIKSVSFVVLDWELNPINTEPHDQEQTGLDLGEAITDASYEENVKFIELIEQHSFAPIFIFTALSPDDVIAVLNEGDRNLYNTEDESRNFILIRQKKNVTGENSMFAEINTWVNSNPAIYSLKKWENSYYKAKNSLFRDLFNKSPKWPEVLWNSYESDMVDPNSNFNEAIFKLVISRTSLRDLEKDKIVIENAPIIQEELKEVVKGMMFLDADVLNTSEVRPGDIFKKGGKYLLNIRPECDTITGRCDGDVYLIKGSKMTSAQSEKYFEAQYSSEKGIRENHDESVLFGVDGNDFVVFKFNQIVKEPFSELIANGNRKCRVLSPFINSIQQKFAAYTGRVGLPKFPHDLMLEVVPGLQHNEEG